MTTTYAFQPAARKGSAGVEAAAKAASALGTPGSLDNRGATFHPPLGKEAPGEGRGPSRTQERWRLRYRIGRLLRPADPAERGPGVCACGAGGYGSDTVTLHLRDEGSRAGASGIYRCDSAWLCPTCAPRRSAERQERVEEVVVAVDRLDGMFGMVTLTVRHKRSDRLSDLKRLVSEASRKARQGKWWTSLQARAGIAGVLSGPEVTYGTSGWHYHVHLGIPMLTQSHVVALQAAQDLVDRYMHHVRLLGGEALLEGQNVQLAISASHAGEYLSKGSAAWEISGGVGTKTRAESNTPFDLAARATAGDREAEALFREYAECLPGTRSCVVTSSMAETLGIEAEDDAEQPGENEENDCIVGELDRDVWDACHRRGHTPQILGRLEREGAAAWPLIRQEAIDLSRPSPRASELPQRVITARMIACRCIAISANRPTAYVARVLDEEKAKAAKERMRLVIPSDREIIAAFQTVWG